MSQSEDLFLGGLILGTMIGAALAVLFTPITGAEVQQRLRKKLEDLKNKSSEAAEKGEEPDLSVEAAAEAEKENEDVVSDTVDSIEEDIIKLSKAVEKVKRSHSKKHADTAGAYQKGD